MKVDEKKTGRWKRRIKDGDESMKKEEKKKSKK